MTSRPDQAGKKVSDADLARAEERGAERVRAEVRNMLEERRRVVRLGDQQIEVVEVSAVEGALDPED